MTHSKIRMTLSNLKSGAPPNDLDTLRKVLSLPWIANDYEEIEIYIEIVLRLTADVITIKFIKNNSIKENYKRLFVDIINKNISDNLSSNMEFIKYFSKLRMAVLSI